MSIHLRAGGDPAGPVLLLLHGLGASGTVWDGLTELLGEWSWLVPDLPGHGRSPQAGRYSFGGLAAAVADLLPRDRPVAVLGHSLGGAVGVALASGWFGVPVAAACGLGIKVRWSEGDLAKAAAVAARPATVFGDRAEAVQRALKVAGLAGLVDPGSAAAATLVAERDGGWVLAVDPAAFAVGAPDLPGMLTAARGQVVLAAGEHDRMGPPAQLAELVRDPVTVPGLGHNAHVEDPAAILPLLAMLAEATPGARVRPANPPASAS